MIRSSLLLFLLLLFPVCAWAQTGAPVEDTSIAPRATQIAPKVAQPSVSPKDATPDASMPSEPVVKQQPKPKSKPKQRANLMKAPNYGSLLIDWGFDFLQGGPEPMSHTFLGSRMGNVYLYYNIRIARSHFVISPGIGFSGERHQFRAYQKDKNPPKGQDPQKEYYTLTRDANSQDQKVRDTKLEPAHTVLQLKDSKDVTASALDVSYLDFLLEARFHANEKYPKESFFVAIGGRLGMLWGAYTTVYYKADQQTKRRIEQESFNLKRFRYGVYTRLGWNRIGAFYAFTLSPLFSQDKGPEGTEVQVHCLGISLDLL